MTDPSEIHELAMEHGLPGGPDHIQPPKDSTCEVLLYPSSDCERLVLREVGSPTGWLFVDCGVVRDLTEEQ